MTSLSIRICNTLFRYDLYCAVNTVDFLHYDSVVRGESAKCSHSQDLLCRHVWVTTLSVGESA